jgi:hypothetical protein
MKKTFLTLAIIIALATGYLYFVKTKSVSVQYRSDTYGYYIDLPKSWEGYTVKKFVKDIYGPGTKGEHEIVGRFLSEEVVHPKSTDAKPRQNIPIYIFTHEQWKNISNEKDSVWSVSAAPFPPSELGRNEKYVFALPARYNYSFPVGFEEVEDILKNNSFSTFSPN